MGVGAKADILAFLIGTCGDWATVSVIAKAVSCSPRTVRRAIDEMTEARFVHTHGSPAEYRVEPSAWGVLLGLDGEPPSWRYWQATWSFMAHLDAWADQVSFTETTDYVLSSHARDLFEAHRDSFAANKIRIAEVENTKGTGFLAAFGGLLSRFAEWLEDS